MTAESHPTSTDSTPEAPGAALLWSLAGLGVLQLAWAAFQWRELIAHRAGEESFCGIEALGDCTVLWDSAFAQSVHQFTQLPVAAWGVVWGFAAALLPLLAQLLRSKRPTLEPFWAATVITALAGAGAVVVLIAASSTSGTFCSNCIGTYLLVVAYAGIAIRAALRRGPVELGRGALTSLAPVAVGFVALLYPAMQTPTAAPEITALVASGPQAQTGADRSAEASPSDSADLGSQGLAQLLEQLQPPAQQVLANALDDFRNSPEIELRAARGIIGDPAASVRLTEFADLLCSHCANLHKQLEVLLREVPSDLLSIEPRYFPLDARCNPLMESPQPPYTTPDTRCVAAKTMICVAGRPEAFEIAGQIFANQATVDPEGVVSIAAGFVPEEQLRACIASEETEAALAEDVQWASEHGIRGTPMILLNGRKIPTNGALIYALLLAGGDPDHPAFDILPPPVPAAERSTG